MCLIMDEVDGMSGGDRGGVADLIKTIARSKVPIIAICNDKYNQKLRSLRNHTLELDFRCVLVQSGWETSSLLHEKVPPGSESGRGHGGRAVLDLACAERT